MSERKMVIAGWVLSGIPALLLLVGAVNAWTGSAQVVQGTGHLGFAASVLKPLGTIECVCALLYLVPRTAFVGAILLTAYLGGAVASHVRVGESIWLAPVILGVVVWAGLTLRDARLRGFLFPSLSR